MTEEKDAGREAFDELAKKLARVPKKALGKEARRWKKRRAKRRKKE